MLVVGLGNPGVRYHNTRHNVGFGVIDQVAEQCHITLRKRLLHPYLSGKGVFQDTSMYLVKPLTFMNNSGTIFPALLRRTGEQIEDTVVICDNMDLEPGMIRIRKRGSHAGQKGLKSIIDATGTSEFIRIYVGIGRPSSDSHVIDHVLGIPADQEMERISGGIARAAAAVIQIVSGTELEQVMNEFNRKNLST